MSWWGGGDEELTFHEAQMSALHLNESVCTFLKSPELAWVDLSTPALSALCGRMRADTAQGLPCSRVLIRPCQPVEQFSRPIKEKEDLID